MVKRASERIIGFASCGIDQARGINWEVQVVGVFLGHCWGKAWKSGGLGWLTRQSRPPKGFLQTVPQPSPHLIRYQLGLVQLSCVCQPSMITYLG